VPALDDCVLVPAGSYRLGEPGEEREVRAGPVLIGRFPVANAHLRRFRLACSGPLTARLEDPLQADHPAVDVTYAEAQALCAWAGGRLPTGAEWEAAARGTDARTWPWGDVFDPERCNCDEAGWGWTVPVGAHPGGAGPFGTLDQAGNVWEWVASPPDADGWRSVRGGSYLDTGWGVRAARALPADPARATPTTGLRLAFDPGRAT
jgi:formylglycine-generating enzyme required for sulfatase activity